MRFLSDFILLCLLSGRLGSCFGFPSLCFLSFSLGLLGFILLPVFRSDNHGNVIIACCGIGLCGRLRGFGSRTGWRIRSVDVRRHLVHCRIQGKVNAYEFGSTSQCATYTSEGQVISCGSQHKTGCFFHMVGIVSLFGLFGDMILQRRFVQCLWQVEDGVGGRLSDDIIDG